MSDDVGRMIAERFRSSSRPSKPAEEDSTGPADPNVGRVLAGRYQIDRLLSVGGMGRVYLAKQLQLDRWVAVKLLARVGGPDAKRMVQRFCLEASISAKLSHPNIVTVHDYGEADHGGELFMAMEFLDGQPLSDVIKAGPLPPARALEMAMQICRGVRAAHAEGVIHRDLKPSNVIVLEKKDEEQNDFLKVLDFGLVKIFQTNDGGPLDKDLTRTDSILGSPRYMAPEQIRQENVDPRTDIYAFGVVLYQMIAGRPPFEASSMIEIFNAHMTREPPPIPGCPRQIDAIIRKCMMKSPDDRYASMHEVMRDLKLAASERSLSEALDPFTTSSTINESVSSDAVPPKKESRSLAVPVTAGVLAIGACIWLAIRSVTPAPPIAAPLPPVSRVAPAPKPPPPPPIVEQVVSPPPLPVPAPEPPPAPVPKSSKISKITKIKKAAPKPIEPTAPPDIRLQR